MRSVPSGASSGLFFLVALAAAACVGNPVPASATHPANPKAPSVVEAAPARAPAPAVDAGAAPDEHGHHHHHGGQ